MLGPVLFLALAADPEVISLLTVVSERPAVETAKLHGSVKSIRQERIRKRELDGTPKDTLLEVVHRTYGSANQVLTARRETQLGRGTAAQYTYEGERLVSVRSHSLESGMPTGSPATERMEYDSSGRLTSRRLDSPSGPTEFTYAYDSQGREVRREIRQGANRALASTTLTEYSDGGRVRTETRQRLDGTAISVTRRKFDGSGLLEELSLRESRLVYAVFFKRDAQGRVVEQNTPPFAIEKGIVCDDCPVQGRIAIRYLDDGVREETFVDPGGKPRYRRLVRLDRDNSIEWIKVSRLETGPPILLDRVFDASRLAGVYPAMQTVWDEKGNWIEKREVFHSPRAAEPVVQFIHRRTIEYYQ